MIGEQNMGILFNRSKLLNLIVEMTLTLDYVKKDNALTKETLLFLIRKDIKKAIRSLDDKDKAEVRSALGMNDYEERNKGDNF